MRAYGVKRKDAGCCPGHDKYPKDRYSTHNTNSEKRKRAQRSRKKSARQSLKPLLD